MEARSHGVLVNAVGFIYASLGFSLSVLAALFSIFNRRKKDDATTIPFHMRPASSSRGRRPVRAPPVDPPSAPPEKAPIPPVPSSPVKVRTLSPESMTRNLRRSFSAHELRRSKSMVPVITVDYFGSPDSPHRVTSAEIVVIDSPQTTSNPTTKDAAVPAVRPFLDSPPSSPPASVSSHSSEPSSKHNHSGFRIFHPKHWGKDKDKSKNIPRRQSSPHLCPMPGLCPSRTQTQSPPHKLTSSDEMISSTSPPSPTKAAVSVKSKSSRSILRKMPSVPSNHEKHCANTSPPRKSEKKRSQTLRTHPYEAPYFALPPLPPLPKHLHREAVNTDSPSRNIDKKQSKPRLTTS